MRGPSTGPPGVLGPEPSSIVIAPQSYLTVDLVLAIGTGAGLAAAAGLRPFLPALLAGALARGNAGIDFGGTDYSFLESPGFLFAVFVVLAVVVIAERGRAAGPEAEGSPLTAAVSGIALGLGALLFAGALADEGEAAWAGIVPGLLCAAVARAVAGDILGRAAGRLDADARSALAVYADAASLVLAGLAVLFGPIGLVAVVFLVILLVRGRRRAGEKYAGLRVLR